MRERDYPIYDTSFPGRRTAASYDSVPDPVLPTAAWKMELAEMDPAQATDVEQAIQDAVALHSDVHLFRKVGSKFFGIGFEHGSGSSVKIFVHPEI
jgi:hypothetical protein